MIGVNINTVPVLDLRREFTNPIIGDRSFSKNKKIVNQIGVKNISLFKKKKIATVIKHIPGHGLAKEDSHKKLPYITHKLSYLKKMISNYLKIKFFICYDCILYLTQLITRIVLHTPKMQLILLEKR